jgi:arginase family enzyme
MVVDRAAFANPPSFMGVPFSRDLTASRAAIIGVPSDCGTHPVPIGARLDPSAIREQSALVRRYKPPQDDFDPVAAQGLVDCGDAAVMPRLPITWERVGRSLQTGSSSSLASKAIG